MAPNQADVAPEAESPFPVAEQAVGQFRVEGELVGGVELVLGNDEEMEGHEQERGAKERPHFAQAVSFVEPDVDQQQGGEDDVNFEGAEAEQERGPAEPGPAFDEADQSTQQEEDDQQLIPGGEPGHADHDARIQEPQGGYQRGGEQGAR